MSALSNKVDVLVVGAGPSGLMAAVELARAGIEVEIIDRAWRSAAQSYACSLHASSLDLLRQIGVDRAANDAGINVDAMRFYEGAEPRAEVRFGQLPSVAGCLLVLPQDRLEEILEEELRARGIRVRWGHRLDEIHQDENAATATVEKLGVTSVGYPFARSEEAVEREIEVRTRFVIGADGSASHVRSLLGIEMQHCGPRTEFEVFEFTPATETSSEVRVAVGPDSLSVYWPQPGCIGRWSFEVPGTDLGVVQKEREAFVLRDASNDPSALERVEATIRKRAPWFRGGIQEIDWTSVVGFESMFSKDFGRGRCWLAGDAGHQTGPVGIQSMNVGLREAADLAQRLTQILRHAASLDLLADYNRARLAEWQVLLGIGGGLVAGPKASAWAAANRQRLLPCLPGSGAELVMLAGQLGLELA